MPLRKGHIALMRSKTDDPTKERQKEKQKCAPMKVHEPHEPKGRRDESTKSQKTESESDTTWPERNAERRPEYKNEPKPAARELRAAHGHTKGQPTRHQHHTQQD